MKTLLLSFLLALPATARIGETKEECQKRYGAAASVNTENGSATFQKNGFKITAHFDPDGRCWGIIYTKVTADIESDRPQALASDEVEILKRANAGDAAWRVRENVSVGRVWDCEAKALRAFYDARSLTIGTAAYFDGAEDRAKAKRAESLKGF